MYQCVIIQQRYPKGKGQGSLQGLTILIVQSPKQEDPLSTCVCHQSIRDISKQIYSHLSMQRAYYTLSISFSSLCVCELTFEKYFLLAINSRCYTTLFTYLKYPTLLFYVLFKKRKKYFDVGIDLSCCSLFNICLLSAQKSDETISLLNNQMNFFCCFIFLTFWAL